MLDTIKDPAVRVYVVWVPMLEMDQAGAVAEATKYLPDARVSHFWDARGALKEAYAPVLQIEQPVWDVYLAYDREAEWKTGQPPHPRYWMHQLGRLGQERRLNPALFAAEVNKLRSPVER